MEDKYIKSKAEVVKKITERRREDVRDQMMELSLASAKPPLTIMTQEEIIAEESRQRRAAEREGRRRRRQQSRKIVAVVSGGSKHADGMSSDDEMSTTDSAHAAKIRSDVENQARQVMSDVVDDFATLDGKCMMVSTIAETSIRLFFIKEEVREKGGRVGLFTHS